MSSDDGRIKTPYTRFCLGRVRIVSFAAVALRRKLSTYSLFVHNPTSSSVFTANSSHKRDNRRVCMRNRAVCMDQKPIWHTRTVENVASTWLSMKECNDSPVPARNVGKQNKRVRRAFDKPTDDGALSLFSNSDVLKCEKRRPRDSPGTKRPVYQRNYRATMPA